jgi:CDP-diacylglycerol--glycerol-3-phosphate 3-phosphatidyltransferase
MLGLASLLGTLSTVGDMLDGQVARLTKTGSNRGELLDAAVDRYTEFAFLGGMLVYFRDSVWLMVLTLAALLASFMVSYASAKAEALQVSPPRGLMRRHERGTYLLVGVGFTVMFGNWIHHRWDRLPWETPLIAALAAVAVIGNGAAILRFVRIGRCLRS